MTDQGLGDVATTTVRIRLETGYRFQVDLGEEFPALLMDEPAPLGEGSGPNAAAVLAASVGNCLSASLLFCLRKARLEVRGLTTEVEITRERKERGRMRIGGMRVVLHPDVAPGGEGRVARCLELFEDFCVVTESVRSGVDVDVDVDLGPGPGPGGCTAGIPSPGSPPDAPAGS